MEGKKEVDVEPIEGEVLPDKDGKHPETVPWEKYVGIKESLGKKLSLAKEQAKSLEEQLKNAPNVEEVKRIQSELEATKAKLTEVSTELSKTKEMSVSMLRESLIKRGVPADKASKMSETEMRTVLDVIGDTKPLPDLSTGGGSGELKGSPRELAVRAYSDKKR